MNKAIERLIKDTLLAALQNPRESAFLLNYMAAQKRAAKKRDEWENKGIHIPPFLIASITSECNLFCKGCYARENQQGCDHRDQKELSTGEWEKIFTEAQDLGIAFILLAGGEPLLRKDIIRAAAQFPRIIFPVFTNGTMMDQGMVDLFHKKRNLVPVLSLEGKEKDTDTRRGAGVYTVLTKTMERMKNNGIFFAVSITVTKENLETVTEDEFIEQLRLKGCGLVFYVEYVPMDKGAGPAAPDEADRVFFAERLQSLRTSHERMIFLSFPGDESATGGCLAAGRGFFHINAVGAAEPCPFSPFSDSGVKNHLILEALQSPLFRKLSQENFLDIPHEGGCALFGREDEIRALLQKNSSPPQAGTEKSAVSPL